MKTVAQTTKKLGLINMQVQVCQNCELPYFSAAKPQVWMQRRHTMILRRYIFNIYYKWLFWYSSHISGIFLSIIVQSNLLLVDKITHWASICWLSSVADVTSVKFSSHLRFLKVLLTSYSQSLQKMFTAFWIIILWHIDTAPFKTDATGVPNNKQNY